MELECVEIGKTALLLAEQGWIWDRQSVAATLRRIGFSVLESVLHRVTFSGCSGLMADVYHHNDQVLCIEITFFSYTDVDILTDLEYEDKVDEFYAAFLKGTDEIAKHLGTPVFSDGAAAAGFPDDQDAEWLSLWNTPSSRLMLQQKHEDRELPFRLCVVVAPKQGSNRL